MICDVTCAQKLLRLTPLSLQSKQVVGNRTSRTSQAFPLPAGLQVTFLLLLLPLRISRGSQASSLAMGTLLTTAAHLYTTILWAYTPGSAVCAIRANIGSTTQTYYQFRNVTAKQQECFVFKRTSYSDSYPDHPHSTASQGNPLTVTSRSYDNGLAVTLLQSKQKRVDAVKCSRGSNFPEDASKNIRSRSGLLAFMWMLLAALHIANMVDLARADGSAEDARAIGLAPSNPTMKSEMIVPTHSTSVQGLMLLTDLMESMTATAPTIYSLSLGSASSLRLQNVATSPSPRLRAYMPRETPTCSDLLGPPQTTATNSATIFAISRNSTMYSVSGRKQNPGLLSRNGTTQTAVGSSWHVVTDSPVVQPTVIVTVDASAFANMTMLNTITFNLSTANSTRVLATSLMSSLSIATHSDTSSISDVDVSRNRPVGSTKVSSTTATLPSIPLNAMPLTTTISEDRTHPGIQLSTPTTGYNIVPLLAPVPFASSPAAVVPTSSTALIPGAGKDQLQTSSSTSIAKQSAQTRVIPVTWSEPNTLRTAGTYTVPSYTPALFEKRALFLKDTTSTGHPTNRLVATSPESPHQKSQFPHSMMTNSATKMNAPIPRVIAKAMKSAANAGAWWKEFSFRTRWSIWQLRSPGSY